MVPCTIKPTIMRPKFQISGFIHLSFLSPAPLFSLLLGNFTVNQRLYLIQSDKNKERKSRPSILALIITQLTYKKAEGISKNETSGCPQIYLCSLQTTALPTSLLIHLIEGWLSTVLAGDAGCTLESVGRCFAGCFQFCFWIALAMASPQIHVPGLAFLLLLFVCCVVCF